MRAGDKSERAFALINKNLCNYPIARDRRLMLRWRKSQTTGRWLCDLEDNIQLRLPSNTSALLRHCPTALDMGILFALLSEAAKQDTAEIELQSYASLLRLLGYSAEARNRQKVKDALALWSHLRLWFKQWYWPNRFEWIDENGRSFADHAKGRKKRRTEVWRRAARQLPPAISSLNGDGRPVRITLNNEWIELTERFFARVPLPLPRDASAQNLALALLTSRYAWDKSGERRTGPRRVRRLCHKIGLSHHNSASKLRRAISVVEDWFKLHGGHLVCCWPPGSNRVEFFILKDVKMRRPTSLDDETTPIEIFGDDEIGEFGNDELGASEDDEAEWRAEFEVDMATKGIAFDDAFDAELKYESWLKRRLRRKDDDERGKLMAVTNEGRGSHR